MPSGSPRWSAAAVILAVAAAAVVGVAAYRIGLDQRVSGAAVELAVNRQGRAQRLQ